MNNKKGRATINKYNAFINWLKNNHPHFKLAIWEKEVLIKTLNGSIDKNGIYKDGYTQINKVENFGSTKIFKLYQQYLKKRKS